MIITCPCEKKQFKIDCSLIPQEGRELQCGSCERVWFYKPKNESEATLILNENISENKINPAIETKDKNLEFSKNLQKEKILKPEIKNKTSKEIPNKVNKLENENKGSKFKTVDLNGFKHEAKVIMINRRFDLCLLRVSDVLTNPPNFKGCRERT